MADFGYMEVTGTCPVTGADGDTTIRVFGNNGDSIYRNIVCPEGHTYTVKVVITVNGAVTEYVID